MPDGDVLMALHILLRIKRTSHGAEIDEIISDVEARKALAVERVRRKQWQRAVEGAAAFKPECCGSRRCFSSHSGWRSSQT